MTGAVLLFWFVVCLFVPSSVRVQLRSAVHGRALRDGGHLLHAQPLPERRRLQGGGHRIPLRLSPRIARPPVSYAHHTHTHTHTHTNTHTHTHTHIHTHTHTHTHTPLH